jgi:hypothetical protein
MKSRRHGRKPTLALWMLVAVADVAVLIATAGLLTVLAVLAGLVAAAGMVRGLWLLQRRTAPAAMLLQRRTAPAAMLLQRRTAPAAMLLQHRTTTPAAVSRPSLAIARRRA